MAIRQLVWFNPMESKQRAYILSTLLITVQGIHNKTKQGGLVTFGDGLTLGHCLST